MVMMGKHLCLGLCLRTAQPGTRAGTWYFNCWEAGAKVRQSCTMTQEQAADTMCLQGHGMGGHLGAREDVERIAFAGSHSCREPRVGRLQGRLHEGSLL